LVVQRLGPRDPRSSSRFSNGGGLGGIYLWAVYAQRRFRHARKMADRRIFTIAFGIILPLAFIVAVALIVLSEMPLMNYMTFFSR
jgi:hypothetical protein